MVIENSFDGVQQLRGHGICRSSFPFLREVKIILNPSIYMNLVIPMRDIHIHMGAYTQYCC
jgi:hypothetical protein